MPIRMEVVADFPPLSRVVTLPLAASKPPRSRNPAIYWHLLSLDAPSVAMLWTWFIARCNGIQLPSTSILAMGVAVWVLYAIDRLLDVRSPQGSSLELRHHFHRRHRKAFRACIALALLSLSALVSRLSHQSIRLYGLLSVPLLAYYLLIHFNGENSTGGPPGRLPKEIAVGIFFSAATFIPTVSRVPLLRASLLPAAILFGAVCSLNCLFIYAWEHSPSVSIPYPEAHPATRFALRFLQPLVILTIAGCFGLILHSAFPSSSAVFPWQLAAALVLAPTLLLLLHNGRDSFNPTTLRAAADLCLLTPFLFAFSLRR